MNKIKFNIGLGIAILALCWAIVPHSTLAAESGDLKISGWIPYWQTSEGIKDAEAHIDELDSIHPFGYTVKSDGSLVDTAKLTESDWKDLFKTADKKDVEVIPTVMWSDGNAIQTVLSDKNLRKKNIDSIVGMIKKGGYAGVDIDYEGKLSASYNDFSNFLKDLKKSLGSKVLVCSIEARTPPSSLYATPPQTIEYANDYDAIGKYCDRVQILAYDQQRADIKLNDSKSGAPYMPIADVDWVRKVLELAMQSIPKQKIYLGVPTYGEQYQVTVSPNWFQSYASIGSLDPNDASKLAKTLKAKPSRNKAGEISFSYLPETNSQVAAYSAPAGTPSGNIVAAKALAYANATGLSTTFNLVWWSDAGAIKQKVDLAKELGIGGISIFKIDGGEDSKLWSLFK